MVKKNRPARNFNGRRVFLSREKTDKRFQKIRLPTKRKGGAKKENNPRRRPAKKKSGANSVWTGRGSETVRRYGRSDTKYVDKLNPLPPRERDCAQKGGKVTQVEEEGKKEDKNKKEGGKKGEEIKGKGDPNLPR